MKLKALICAALAGGPLILGASASGGFVEVVCRAKPNEFGLLVVNVYAVFDRPGEDILTGVAGTPNNPLLVEVKGGTFYQHRFGDDQAPSSQLVADFPSLAFDTFVGIGLKLDNEVILTPTWPGFGDSVLWLSGDGWAITPDNPDGDPFNPDNDGPLGDLFIGQFSTADGVAISGTMLLSYVTNGVDVDTIESFFCGLCETDEECSDGDPCNGQEGCLDSICLPQPPDPDCNGNGVLDACDIAAGTSTDANANGVPDDCDVLCRSDLDHDGIVGILDFLQLLADWGACP